MSKTCPINWTKEDGPYPCPFQQDARRCSYNPIGFKYDLKKNCIPQHLERFNHDSRDAVVTCKDCGKSIKTTVGEIERDSKLGIAEYRCYDCADEYYGWSLAAHIRGDC